MLPDWKEACEAVSEEFGDMVDSFAWKRLAELPSPTYFRGKTVLDIGSGSSSGHDHEYKEVFEPWFCRILQKIGAEPIAVDQGDNTGEAFEHHRFNLVTETLHDHPLRFLGRGRKVDIVHNFRFLPPWRPLGGFYGYSETNQSPSLFKHWNDLDRTRKALNESIRSLLKGSGVYFWEHELFQKTRGRLQRVCGDTGQCNTDWLTDGGSRDHIQCLRPYRRD